MSIKGLLNRLDEIPEEIRRGDTLTCFEIGEAYSDSGELWAVTPRELEYIRKEYREEFDNFWTVSEPYPI